MESATAESNSIEVTKQQPQITDTSATNRNEIIASTNSMEAAAVALAATKSCVDVAVVAVASTETASAITTKTPDRNNRDVIAEATSAIIIEEKSRDEIPLDTQQQSMVDFYDITLIKDRLNYATEEEELQEVALVEADAARSEEEEEEQDHLAPLMMDSHTVLQHQEIMKDSITMSTPMAGLPHQVRESFSSISDSDLSDGSSFNKHHPKHMVRGDEDEEYEEYRAEDSSASASSDDNTKDSGCDLKLQTKLVKNLSIEEDKQNDYDDEDGDDECNYPLEIPDDEELEKIVEQVEFYFSNENILKDAFLLKHVRRNKEGYVSLKLVSSFKRVRQIVKDWRVVGVAVKKLSKHIELNDPGTKIRRIEPLPTHDETMPSRTVVATDLNLDKMTIEKVSDIFAKCGDIALIRILKPGGAIPADVRQFINKHPELQEKECALVEYTESKYARKAFELKGMTVYEMVAPKKKTGNKKATIAKLIESYKLHDAEMERTRGGFNKPRRPQPPYYVKQHSQELGQPIYSPIPRKYSYGNEQNEQHFTQHRRSSNCSDASRKYSSCSEGYSSCSDMSRRPSSCSDHNNSSSSNSRRTSNCSDFCSCGMRRMSQCSNNEMYVQQTNVSPRRMSMERKFSNPQMNYDRRMSVDYGRRFSTNENEYIERKLSSGSMNYEYVPQRKFSNGFDPMRKLSNTSMGDQYCNFGRRISTDSGYDRKTSVGSNSSMSSDYVLSPAARAARFQAPTCAHTKSEALVRTPIGPDGSKGFASRARKVGQVIVPV